MAKRKRDDETLINMEGYQSNERYKPEVVEELGAFKPKVEILSISDSDSSLLAPKTAPIPKKMLPRHLQKGKPYQPKKAQEMQAHQALNNNNNAGAYPGYEPQADYYSQPNNLPTMINGTVPPPLNNNASYPTPSVYPVLPPMPMQYYGEVPLAPIVMKEQSNADKPKVQQKKFLRTAGADIWEDPTLAEWSANDYRIFVGNLGNEVTDDGLKRAFMQYKSLNKARVVRDKRNMKSKGYGFVSFLDPQDFLKAMKEMQGKYIANRPCKLEKSKWDSRNLDKFREKYGDPVCMQDKKERLEKIQPEAKKEPQPAPPAEERREDKKEKKENSAKTAF